MEVAKAFFERAVQAGTTVDGVVYSEELAGPDGLDILLLPAEGTTPESIEACREKLHAEHDVVAFNAREVPADWYAETTFVPGPERGWLDAVKWIVQHQCCRRVDAETGQLVPEGKRGGMLLDLFSAGAMLQVYEALSEANRVRLVAMTLPLAHGVVFRILTKAR